jgi:hypothetical protein
MTYIMHLCQWFECSKNAKLPTTPFVIFSLTEDILLTGKQQQGGSETNNRII